MLIDSEKLKEKIAGIFKPNAYTSFEEKQVMERYKVSVDNAIYYAELDAKKNEQAVAEKYADKYAERIEKASLDSYNHGFADGKRSERMRQEEEVKKFTAIFQSTMARLFSGAASEIGNVLNEVKSHDA